MAGAASWVTQSGCDNLAEAVGLVLSELWLLGDEVGVAAWAVLPWFAGAGFWATGGFLGTGGRGLLPGRCGLHEWNGKA